MGRVGGSRHFLPDSQEAAGRVLAERLGRSGAGARPGRHLLICAVDEDSPHHGASHEWLSSALNGERRVGLPWLRLGAFVRIVTNPRASRNPLSPSDAWGFVEDWRDCDVALIPGGATTPRFSGA